MTTAAFFRLGAEAPFVQGVKFENYPYSVSLNCTVTPPTLTDAEILLTSAHMNFLKDRVQVDSTNSNIEIVDNFFKVACNENAPRNLALKTWGDLQWRTRVIGFGSGGIAGGLALIALKGAPVYIVVALFTGIVAFLCLVGGSWHRYHIADNELTMWKSPGEDFALKRKAALEFPLQQMIQKKCHFCPKQLTGTLLGVEMLSVFRRDFKKFATTFLARTCDTPEQQHKWVSEFLEGNLVALTFFEENSLANEWGWENVLKFQNQISQLRVLINTLQEEHVGQFNKNKDAAKQKSNDTKKNVSEKAKAFSERNKILPLRAQLYLSRVSKIMKTEYLDKIHELSLREKAKADFCYSLVYSQVRALLEEAQKGLLEDKPYVPDEKAFKDPSQFVLGNFQEELDAICAPYPQNVIEKSKAIDKAVPLFHQFVDAAFA